jgi:ABC transport system ATP-binding/permease protein
MTYLSVEQLSKSYGIKTLFNGLTFGISKGHKTALVAPNGTGKSTLLKVIAGQETHDSGTISIRNGISIGFLEQEPRLDDKMSIAEYITHGHSDVVTIIKQYEKAVHNQSENYNDTTQIAFEKAMAAMDATNAWDYEQRMQQSWENWIFTIWINPSLLCPVANANVLPWLSSCSKILIYFY